MTDDLATWLLEQITKDERRANVAGGRNWEPGPCEPGCWCCRIEGDDITIYDEGGHSAEQAQHIAAWDPFRVLAECDVKGRIVAMYINALAARETGSISDWNRAQDAGAASVLHDAVRLLALPYAERPGYREEWRP